MKMRPKKATGSFNLHKDGCYELIVHMEADPGTLSFAEFNFETVLPRDKARDLAGLTAYLLRHEAGLFVIAVEPTAAQSSPHISERWHEADRVLASRGIWLFATTHEELLSEPSWSNAMRITRAAQADVDPDDQERIVEYLSLVGHDTVLECARLCQASGDSCDAVLKLVSAGVLQFDDDGPISLNSHLCLRDEQHTRAAMRRLRTRLRVGARTVTGSG